MGLAPVENLKGFASSRPPIVIFMVCLGLFAFVLLSLAFYVQSNELQNPNVAEDWNMFLDSFADLEFCVQGNSSEASPYLTTDKTTAHPGLSARDVRSSPAPPPDETSAPATDSISNHSVSMLVTFYPTRDFLLIPHNMTHLTTTIFGRELGLKGVAGDEVINVSMEIANDWNRTQCSGLHGRCKPIKVFTCVYFQAPAHVFPDSKIPPQCSALNDTMPGMEYNAVMRAHNPGTYTTFYCKAQPFIKVKYNLDPTLTVWLSLHDRSVINLHLLHTSYFLFVMVLTLLCYATIRGRPLKSKNTQTGNAQESLLSEA
ncbi:hypothetical protein CAPTEDRAFT_222725 [Capitella teleta]|uniref:TMEM248/TMEM219 domain-containing protein n=1 Tax=Capitella teleta TaxID=283909 RepID=R7T9T4_CAPTE|nr:hypothetical protein CAPTEDRAFT_222725 [Capitella teleta]|eukprot:ELT90464.1 hypothetical protein CAPTEDRAFT_222725 [Capitella teleta]